MPQLSGRNSTLFILLFTPLVTVLLGVISVSAIWGVSRGGREGTVSPRTAQLQKWSASSFFLSLL